MTDLAPTEAAGTARAERASWAAVTAVTAATFTVVTSEMMPVGLLTPIAEAVGVAEGTAGLSLTITGVLGAVFSPIAPVLIGRLDRKIALVAFMALLAVANLVSAIATSFTMFMFGRVLLGVSLGVVWGLAPGLGPRLVPAPQIGRAMSWIFSGVAIASVAGVPIGTYLAAQSSWQAAFVALAGLGLIVAVLLAVLMPRLRVADRATVRGMFSALHGRGVRSGLLITGLVVTGHFAAYTYVRPLLDGTGAAASAIALLLALYGGAGIAGTFGIGPLAALRPRAATLLVTGGIAAAIILLPLTPDLLLVAILMAFWGAAYGGVAVSTQSWTRQADPTRVGATAAIWSGVFNASIAIGAALGGVLLDHLGTSGLMWTAAGIAFAATTTALVTRPRR